MDTGLSLHPVGLSDEERKILSVTMNVLMAGGCGVSLADRLSNNTVAVIDVDSDEGRSFYESAVGSHLKVVISGNEGFYRAEGHIRKPLRVQALKNLLAELSEKFSDANEPRDGEAEQPGCAPHSADERLPDDTLFYVVANAATRGELCRIACDDASHLLLLHGPSRHLYTNMSRQRLREVACLQGSRQLKVIPLDEFSFMKQARGLESIRIEKLLWFADRKGARGYVPVRGNHLGRFQLTDWPRFDARNVRPEYLSLAAILTRRAYSHDALARLLGIPVGTVFDFYHAASACGLVQLVSREAADEAPPAAAVPSLISRIAKKLGLHFF